MEVDIAPAKGQEFALAKAEHFIIPNGIASGMWTQFSITPALVAAYNQVPANADAHRGDIAVYGNAPSGHVVVVLSDAAASSATLDAFEQNSPIGSASHETTNRTKADLLGYLRPKNAPSTASPTAHSSA